MAETTNADILSKLDTFATDVKARIEGLATDSRARDREQTVERTRFEERMTAAVGAVQNGLTTLGHEVEVLKECIPKLEKHAADASLAAKDAVTSHLALESAHQDRWNRVMERLDAQDSADDEREKKRKEEEAEKERIKKEAREQESLAARRLEQKRAHEEKMVAAKTPRVVALVALIGSVVTIGGSYLTARAAHEPTDTKLVEQTARLSRLESQVSSVAVAVNAPAVGTPAVGGSGAPAVVSAPSPAPPATGVATMTASAAPPPIVHNAHAPGVAAAAAPAAAPASPPPAAAGARP
jgi:hypothetical protein